MSATSEDERWMRSAIEIGKRNLGQVWPSPAVGCVLVKGGELIARGWTGRGGTPHAETVAIREAGERCSGTTAYVSLEPCSHFGRTPPCTNALIEAGVARVVTAMTDPDPRVSGMGHQLLKAAGIDVCSGVLQREAEHSHAGFISRITRRKPLVTLKFAATLDGRIATMTGESQWITSQESRRHAHLIRAQHDAILVGRRTAVTDDPSLTVRIPGIENRSPVRVVFDSRARTPVESRLGTTARNVPVWICHTEHATDEAVADWREAGAKTICVTASPSGNIDLKNAMTSLADEGLTRILCEGGAELSAGLMREQLVDELLLYSAGSIIGSEGKAVIGATNWSRLGDTSRFRRVDVSTIGNDMLSHWVIEQQGAPA